MSKRNPVGGGSSGASQPAAPSSKRRKLSAGEEAEQAARGTNDCAMRGVRELGRRPKESVKSPLEERRLATRLRKAKRRGKQSEEQKEELAAMSAKELGSLEEVDLPPDPTDPFADMADNRLEQDLLMVRNGLIPKKVKQRMTRYRKCLTHPGACSAIVQKYKDQVFQAERAAMNANDSERASSSRASQRAEAARPPQSVMEEIRNFFRKFGDCQKRKAGKAGRRRSRRRSQNWLRDSVEPKQETQ